MFGWLKGSSECPVDEKTRIWLEGRWLWLCDELGRSWLRDAELVLPLQKFFPDRYDAADLTTVRVLFDRVCKSMRTDPLRFRLRVFSDSRQPARPFSEFRPDFAGAGGLYDRQGLDCTIWILDRKLDDPLSLVATIAHEMGHEHLLGRERLKGTEADHEPLTDLVSVFMGLGVIAGNAVLSESSLQAGNMTYWSLGRSGYLDMRSFGYALALFARMRGETKPGWRTHLRPDVKAAFDQGGRYVERTSDPRFAPLA